MLKIQSRKNMKSPWWLVLFTIYMFLNNSVCLTKAIEPLSTGIATGVAVLTSALFAGYQTFTCHFTECCAEPWFQPNITGLKEDLEDKLHGQHVVIDAVIRSIAGHVKFPEPEKALVLSFHGTTGSGKNFVSRIIADNLYKLGMSSQYVHLFHAPSDFPHEAMVPIYQDQLRQWIRGNVSTCARHVFIFDEVDKMPPNLINAVKPFLDHYPEIQGVDYRKNIFILLSNTGGKQINDFTFQQWQSGRKREEIQYKELEQVLTGRAFNEKGFIAYWNNWWRWLTHAFDSGLWHSSLIDHNLVSAFIPFLPLERRHVKQCIQDDVQLKKLSVTRNFIERVADEMQYTPDDVKLFSKTGCKRVSEKVNFYSLYDEI